MLGRYGLYLAWVVAVVATLGSLYFSEVRHFVPCVLCWYQRILMYPLVLLLGVATYRNDRGIVGYALPFSLLGVLVSSYHYLHQKIPGFGPPGVCAGGVPCSGQYINWLGFITIPFLALTAFIIISVALIAVARATRGASRRAVGSGA